MTLRPTFFSAAILAVIIVLHHLEINQPIGKNAEEEREKTGRRGCNGFGYSISLAASLVDDRLHLILARGRAPAEFSLTMLCSVIGIIFR